jgi:hypothetical protein
MARECPICRDRPVTKPNLGMCNVCFAQEHGGRVGRAQQSEENKAIHATILRRMQMKKNVAEGLRQAAARAEGDLKTLLERAAIIADDGDVLLHGSEVYALPAVLPSPVEKQPVTTQVELASERSDDALVILHAGQE